MSPAGNFLSYCTERYKSAKGLNGQQVSELFTKYAPSMAAKSGVVLSKYNCVGAITIPGALPLPMPDITVNTRKGVYVSYQPDTRAG